MRANMNVLSGCCFSILLLCITISRAVQNDSLVDIRQPRVTGRIVKWYSGTRPEPIACSQEGFQGDPQDCAVFYRCIKSTQGRYVVYRFQCGPGTVYDPETEVCNHPKNTKRSECIGYSVNNSSNDDNEIDYMNNDEIPTPIKNNKLMIHSDDTTTKKYAGTNAPINIQFTSATDRNKSIKRNSEKESHCKTDGFIGDPENCKIFYRCVGNGRGNFIRYEFSCSDTTIWDEEIQSCNHPSLVRSSKCGLNDKIRRSEDKNTNEFESSENPTVQQQTQINYGSKVSQVQSQISNGSSKQNQTQINYGDRVSQSQKQENHGSNASQDQTQISHGAAVSQSQTQVNYGDRVTQSQTQIDHTNQASQTQTQTSEKPNDKPSQETQPTSTSGSGICKTSGFIGDPNDCKIFYRCVDNGRGSYTKYEFSCGEGTVWDQDLEACNHAWAVKNCGSNMSAMNTTTKLPQTTTEHSGPVDNIDEIDDEDNGYGMQNEIPSSEKPSSTSQATTTEKNEQDLKSQNNCTQSGFMGDGNDCKKFYRCVDNGKGSYTKYEYTCGEGTVWDPDIEACNHAWAVRKCGGSSTTDINKVETTTNKETSQLESVSTTSTIPPVNDDSGYDQPITTQSSTSTTTTPKSTNSPSDIQCQSAGFMGDKDDCTKFYRCVDNGNGGYTRFEFTCGDGTVWDQSIENCNHAWAVKDCGKTNTTQDQATTPVSSSSGSTTGDNIEETTITSTTIISSTTTETTQSSSSTTKPNAPNDKCESEGFVGDSNNCKKFYRCVSDGKGNFTMYEFECGEGTLWDSEITACNHERYVKRPCSNNTGSTQTTTTSWSNNENEESTTPNMNTNTNPTTTDNISSNEETTHQEINTTKKPISQHNCTQEGFMADNEDCKKFYRCVDNGQGGFTQYEYACGDGTVWDQEILACNHPSGNKNCKTSTPASSATTTTTSSTTEVIHESDEMYTESTTTQTSKPSSTTKSSSTTTPSSTTKPASTTKPNTPNDRCESEGFQEDKKDCKKFYRCVDNGKGGYTRYDFTCGEGTVWDQEIQGCNHDSSNRNCTASKPDQNTMPPQQSVAETTEYEPSSTEQVSSSTSAPTDGGKCTAEGFYANPDDCKKFYRCVDNGGGGYTKYDFTCGEGTVWVQEILACDHASDDTQCKKQGSEPHTETTSAETTVTTSTTPSSTTPSPTTSSTTPEMLSDEDQSENMPSTSKPASTDNSNTQSHQDKCSVEGYFGNSQDCKKFYRCVDNGKRGYTKYDFDCGEGTIWDQDIKACNHPRDVNNPSCKETSATTAQMESSSSSSQSTTESTGQSTSSGTDKTTQQSSSTSSSTKKPDRKQANCTQAGFYPDPDDCKKFYRCVDWAGDGTKFSVFYFECGEGTIWDPALDTCNYEDSVYPPRNCTGTDSQQESNATQESTTTTSTTTASSTTTTSTTTTTTTTTTESTTASHEDSSTTEKEKTTTDSSTTQPQTTTDSTGSTQESTTGTHSNEETTTQMSTTSEATSGEQTTTTEQSTTTTQRQKEETTTDQSTTTTTSEQTSQGTEQTTTELSSSEQTTPVSNEETTKHDETTTTESSTDKTTTQSSSTEGESTTQSQSSTTESQESSTERSTESPAQKECPKTDNDQNLYVCPTGFRRHPKYCNMFYQCTEDDDTHEVKVATFTCPNNTIYDENKTQCLEENKAGQKCNGKIAQKTRFKRSDIKEPMVVSGQNHSCPNVGHYQFDREDECSPAFLKCERSNSGKLRGFVYQCPNNYVYWAVSRRCEPKSKLRDCRKSINNWNGRWEIPVERRNVAP